MGYAAYKHRRAKVGKARYRSRDFSIAVRVKREPVHVRGTIYGVKVKKEPAFHAIVCTGGSNKRCVEAQAHGPTAAVRKALSKFAKSMR